MTVEVDLVTQTQKNMIRIYVSKKTMHNLFELACVVAMNKLTDKTYYLTVRCKDYTGNGYVYARCYDGDVIVVEDNASKYCELI